MANISRRKFIVGASAGVVVVGAAAAAGFEVGAAQNRTARPTGKVTDPIMVYVVDPSKADIKLLVGAKEVTFSDQDLVNRLIQAAQ
jgi:hypothetical protein